MGLMDKVIEIQNRSSGAFSNDIKFVGLQEPSELKNTQTEKKNSSPILNSLK